MRKAISEARKGKSWGKHTEESKRKIGESNHLALSGKKRKPLSEETKRKISISNSITHKKMWAKIPKEERRKILDKWIKAGCSKNRDTYIEIAVQNQLDLAGIKYEKQKHIGSYFIDIYLPDKNIAIECDGDYWHNLEGRKEHDEQRDKWLLENKDIIVMRIPERLIRKDVKGVVDFYIKLLKIISA